MLHCYYADFIFLTGRNAILQNVISAAGFNIPIILAVDRRSRISRSFLLAVDRIDIYGPVINSVVFLIILF